MKAGVERFEIILNFLRHPGATHIFYKLQSKRCGGWVHGGPRTGTDPQRMKYVSGSEEELGAHLLLLMGPRCSAHSRGAARCRFGSWRHFLTAPCLLGSTEPCRNVCQALQNNYCCRRKNDQRRTPKLTPPQTADGNGFWKCLHSVSYESADIAAVVCKTGEGLFTDDNELRKALVGSRGRSNEPTSGHTAFSPRFGCDCGQATSSHQTSFGESK